MTSLDGITVAGSFGCPQLHRKENRMGEIQIIDLGEDQSHRANLIQMFSKIHSQGDISDEQFDSILLELAAISDSDLLVGSHIQIGEFNILIEEK